MLQQARAGCAHLPAKGMIFGQAVENFSGIIEGRREESHSGLVRPPAKRLAAETWLQGSNPCSSAKKSLRETGGILLSPPEVAGARAHLELRVSCS